MAREVVDGAAAAFGLGTVVGAEERHGGVNRVWRLTTTTGAFAVHELLGMPSSDDCQRIFELESAAFDAGVPVARAVPLPDGRAALPGDGGPVTVHEWVDAEPLGDGRGSPAMYGLLGDALGALHGLDIAVPTMPGDPLQWHLGVDGWRDLAEQAARRDLAWAHGLRAAAPELVDALERIDGWLGAAGDAAVFGHRDLTPANVLEAAGRPTLIDWESAGPITPADELGRTALDHLTAEGRFEPVRLRALLAGYAGRRGLPVVGHHWLSLWLRGLVVFAEQCARSCVEGTAPPSLLAFQSAVVASTVPELRRRLAGADGLVAQLREAADEVVSGNP